MQKRRQFHRVWRGLWYMVGLVVLAFGITMNTKTGLGISPIVSVAYAVSQVGGWNFGDMTFGLYAIFVAVQLVLHGRSDLPAEEKKKRLVSRDFAIGWLLSVAASWFHFSIV